MRDRKGVDLLDGKGGEGRGTEEVEGEETINCVYYMRKNIFFFSPTPSRKNIYNKRDKIKEKQ